MTSLSWLRSASTADCMSGYCSLQARRRPSRPTARWTWPSEAARAASRSKLAKRFCQSGPSSLAMRRLTNGQPIGGVEPERREQLLVAQRAAGPQHREILLGETRRRALIDGIERVHQAIAERIGVDVERRMDEMRNIGPVVFVESIELDRRAETLALDVEPDLAEPVRGELALAPLVMDAALELDEGD